MRFTATIPPFLVVLTAMPAQGGAQADAPKIVHTWESFTVADGLPANDIRSLRLQGDRLWVGTRDGLALYETGHFSRWSAAEGLPWPQVSAIDVDNDTGDVWIGTLGGGLLRFSAGRFDRFDQFNSGLAGDLVFDVRVAHGRIWAATNGGVNSFDWVRGDWGLHLERRGDAAEKAVIGLLEVDQRILAVSWVEGLWRLPSPGDETGVPILLEGGPSEGLLAATRGPSGLVALTGTRIWRRGAENHWTSSVLPDSAAGIRVAASDAVGLWLGTERGLTVVTDEGATEFDLPMLRRPVRALATGSGEIWVGTNEGLVHGTSGSAPGASRRPRRVPATRPVTESEPDGTDVAESRRDLVAVLGRSMRTVLLPGALSPNARPRYRVDLLAIQVAAEQHNRSRQNSDHRAMIVETEPASFKRYAWGLVEDVTISLERRRRPVAMLGAIGPEQRIFSLVAWELAVPLMNASADEPTIDEIANPWIFRCRIDDPRAHARVLDHAFDVTGSRRFVVLRTGNPLEQFHLDWWADHARLRGFEQVTELYLSPGEDDVAALVERLETLEFDALLVWADLNLTASLIEELRGRGLDQLVLGSDAIVQRTPTNGAWEDAGLVFAPDPCRHREVAGARDQFVEQYRSRSVPLRTAPDRARLGIIAFDATHHLGEALAHSGGDRSTLRRQLTEMSTPVAAQWIDGAWEVQRLPTDDPAIRPVE